MGIFSGPLPQWWLYEIVNGYRSAIQKWSQVFNPNSDNQKLDLVGPAECIGNRLFD